MLRMVSRLAPIAAIFVFLSASGWPLEAQQPAATSSPTPTPVPADQKALDSVIKITDPAALVAALDKMRADFPKSDLLRTVDQLTLNLLTGRFPQRTTEIGQTLDRMKARLGPDATPRDRSTLAINQATQLIATNVMLDRAETLLAEASAYSFELFAKDERALAEKSKQPVPTDEALKTRFTTGNGRLVLTQRGLLQLARKDLEGAEQSLREATGTKATGAAPVANALGDVADAFAARGDVTRAETMLREVLEANPDVQRLYFVLGSFYAKHNEIEKAKAVINKRLNATPAPNFVPGELLLAELESRSGDHKASLTRYLKLAAAGSVQGADYDTMTGVYRKVHGSEAGLDAEIDRTYRELFPNPVKPEHWKPVAARNSRVVLAQMFTGSGCPPCVSADLAMEAMMERYPADAFIALAYHVNWPRPDPMGTTGGQALTEFHDVGGVPSLVVDGRMAADDKGESLGGGNRAATPGTYKAFIGVVDRALAAPATAELSVRAQVNGDQVDVIATITKLPANAKNLRLHLVLAERELTFSGENGIRFHPMVVRGMTGPNAEGLALSGTGTQKYTFTLASIRDDIVASLANDVAARRARASNTAAPQVFAAEGKAMTKIDPGQLVVVAYVQDGEKRVLQATKADVRRE